ncbi:MAG: hypothetical protein HY081_10760 [Gammaproteobacteria bacterium]|nr:hypothetical protein [Gammaproteobacteria bacterium]
MTTRSIFQKVCPGCMTTLPSDAKQCACGFDFDHTDAITGPTSGEIRVNAEALYETYLAARVQQANDAIKAIQKELVRDPMNKKKSIQLMQAMDEAHAAKEALAAQSAHLAQLKKSQQAVVAPATAPLPVVAHVPVSAPLPISIQTPVPIPVSVSITTTLKKRAEARTQSAKKPAVTSAPVRATTKTVTASKSNLSSTKRRGNTVTITSSVAAKKNSSSTTVRKKPVVIPVKTPPTIGPQSRQATQTAQPNEAFRQAQSAKAEKIVREVQNAQPAVAVTVPPQKEIASTAASIETKLPSLPVVTAKSAPRLYVSSDKKDCPNCTSAVAANLARCRCGYEFPSSGQLIPALSMSEEERAEFAKLFSNL